MIFCKKGCTISASVAFMVAVAAPQAFAGTMTMINFLNQANFSWLKTETDPSGATGIYFPGGPNGNVILGGIPFDIRSNSADNQAWNAWVAAGSGAGGGQVSISIPIGVFGVTDVFTLINTYWGSPAPASLIFVGSSGATYTDDLITNSDIRNWCCGGAINGTSTINVFAETSPINGAAGVLDMQAIALPAEFATQTLNTIELVDDGSYGVQRTILDGVTVESRSATIPEPGTLGLFGTGLIGALAAARHRHKAKS